MKSTQAILLGIVVIIGVLTYVVLKDKSANDQLSTKLDEFELPSFYNNNNQSQLDGTPPSAIPDTGSSFILEDASIPTPSPTPIITPSPSPSPKTTHQAVDTAIGDTSPSLLVFLFAGLAFLATFASRKLSNI